MLVLMTFTMMITAPIMMVGGVIMALREDVGLSWLVAVAVPVLAVTIGFIVSRMIPGFRVDAEAPRHRQPGVAGADHRHSGDPRLRA